MITCPSCNHQNPEGSLQCENCYTPLPATTSCPNCGASVQTDATFCGQCGFNLQAENTPLSASIEETAIGSMPNMSIEDVSLPEELPLSGGKAEIMPETAMSSPIQSPWDDDDDLQTVGQVREMPSEFSEVESPGASNFNSEFAEADIANLEEPNFANEADEVNEVTMPWQSEAPELDSELSEIEESVSEAAKFSPEPEESINQVESPDAFALDPPEAELPLATNANAAAMGPISGATQLQIQTASLLHLQSNTTIEISSHLDVVHIGKPNTQIPPDIDVAGFPDSEVVSRIHADIRIEGDAYYIEDVGSSNGTYINHAPLVQGNRHRLRKGDRIALGKGDLVTFIFQLS